MKNFLTGAVEIFWQNVIGQIRKKMENFLYSINATVPVFLIIVLGYVLARAGMLNAEFVRVANKFNFTVTLPALLLRDIAGVDIRAMFDLKYVLFCAAVTTISFFSVWFAAKRILKDREIIGAFVQASFRSSAAVLGIAFIQNMYGNSGMAPLMIIGSVPLYNIYSVIVLTFEANAEDEAKPVPEGSAPEENAQQGRTDNLAPEGSAREGSRAGRIKSSAVPEDTLPRTRRADRAKLREAGINILKNPIILAIAAGIAISLLRIDFPAVVDKTVASLAAMASPLALIAIGAGFEGKKALAKLKPSCAAAFLKLVGFAAIFLPAAVLFGFRNEKLIALLVMLASPTTPSCYIMAKNMHNDGVITSSIIVLTTLFSAFTLTMWIYILKSAGLV